MWKLAVSRLITAPARFLHLANVALAAIIFIADWKTPPDVATGVLYTAVVLIASRFSRAQGIVLTAFGCACLTLLAYSFGKETSANAILGTIAIGVAALLGTVARATENELRRNEEEWREVFEHNPLMYFMVDAAGTIQSVNAVGAAALGYRADELMGQSLFEVIPGSDRERVRGNLGLCLERPGQLNTWEALKVCKDGTTLSVGESAKAVERAHGDVVVLIACEDITKRKRAEEAVREGAKRSRALIEHAFDVVLLLDRDYGILYASPSVERVLGYAPRELVGRNGLDLIHPDQLEDARNLFATALVSQDSVFTSERLIQHKYGAWIWTENTMTNLLAEPSVRAFVVNLRDISGRKQAEKALRESEQRFRDYAETASDWFWESGPDHRFTVRSGSSSNDALGATRWELAADLDEEPEKWRAHCAILDAHEPFRGFMYKARERDGSTVDLSVSGKPVFDPNGRFLGYRGVATDVSDAVRANKAERALQEVRMELAHANRVATMGQLTASIAHEVRQPIAATAINAGAATRWLSAVPPNLEQARQALDRIVKDSSRAEAVIDRIRALFKREPQVRDRLQINELIQEVTALTHSEAVKTGVSVLTRLAEDAPILEGDRVQLQQVILNLVVNAVEAMSGSSDGARELMISAEEAELGGVLVTVKDSGPGLSPESLGRVFDAFYTTKPGGLGLGLSICRSIIEWHGGRLWASANTPRGAIFQFTLPALLDVPT